MLILALLAAGMAAAQPARTVAAKTDTVRQESPVVKREAMRLLEKSIDARLELTNPPDPFDVLGDTRGIYLQGFGVVLTAQVDLIKVPGISPFHQTITPEERPRLHARKVLALARLKDAMKAVMITAASDLRSVPLNENIVVGVTLFSFIGEDISGLPAQIVMQATRQQLVTNQGADSIKVQEF